MSSPPFFKALVSCFPGLWGFGLDEAAGLVWSSEMLRVSCWQLGSARLKP